MKRLSCSLVLAAMVASSASVAASTTDIRVTGAITPTPCTPSFSAGGVFYLGKTSASDLSQSQNTELRRVTQQLTITCNAATRFAFGGDDQRTDSTSSPGPNLYGLGEVSGHKLGFYRILFLNTLVDGNGSKSYYSFDEGASWRDFASVTTFLYKHDVGLNGFGSVGSTEPTPVTVLVSDVEVEAQIAPINGLDLTGEIQLDGAMTIDLVYLRVDIPSVLPLA